MAVNKTIYFVRHGQTELNKKWVHQFPDTRLSRKGHLQAVHTAEKLGHLTVDVIISSPLERAKETAESIAHTTGARVEYSDLLVELRRPKNLWGTHWLNPRSLWTMGLSYLRAGQADWHYSDEENLEEFQARARRALEMLADRPEENIVVVTHRGLMAAIFESIKRDGMDTLRQYRRALWKNLSIRNCCFQKATWSPEGPNGNTLDGTWSLEGKPVCPK